ncbi:unnamed protein product, partial [Tilletia controversa]
MASMLGSLTRKQSGASAKMKKHHAQAQAQAAAAAAHAMGTARTGPLPGTAANGSGSGSVSMSADGPLPLAYAYPASSSSGSRQNSPLTSPLTTEPPISFSAAGAGTAAESQPQSPHRPFLPHLHRTKSASSARAMAGAAGGAGPAGAAATTATAGRNGDDFFLNPPAMPFPAAAGSASSHSSHTSSTLAAYSTTEPSTASSIYPPASASSVTTVSGTSYFQQQQSQLLGNNNSAHSSDPVNDGLVKDLCQKRIQSIVYLKKTLEGRQSWLNTVRMSKRDLVSAFETEKMRKRTIRNMYLGLSLAPVIEMNSLSDLCKTITNLFAELESWSENVDKDRSKVVRNLFRTTRGSKRLGAASGGLVEFMGAEAPNLLTNEYTYLLTPNLPFSPDYFHTFFTLADMLQEVYYKILLSIPSSSSKSAPPSAFNPGTASSISTVGSNSISMSTSPVSKIGRGAGGSLSLSTSQTGSAHEPDLNDDFGRLLGVTSGQAGPSGKEVGISNGLVDLIHKVDGKLKKILIQTAKEVDALARHLMKEEITILELQVRNLPNSSGSTALAPGANLAGVSSPLMGGDRTAFDGPRASQIGGGIGSYPPGPGSDRGSLMTPSPAMHGGLSGLSSPPTSSPALSRDSSSQGQGGPLSPGLPNRNLNHAGPGPGPGPSRPPDPGLPNIPAFRSPPGWSMAPAVPVPPPPPPPPPPGPLPPAPAPAPPSASSSSSSHTTATRTLLGRKSSDRLGKMSNPPSAYAQAAGPPPRGPLPPIGSVGAGMGGGGGGGTPPPSVPPPPLPASLPARHGKTPSFSATSSGFEPGSLTFVPTHGAGGGGGGGGGVGVGSGL